MHANSTRRRLCDTGIEHLGGATPFFNKRSEITAALQGIGLEPTRITGGAYVLNDQNGRAVSMLSAPFNLSSDGLFEFSDWNAGNEIGYAEGIYIVNGKSIKYGFHSSDSTPKFRIEKLFSDYSQNSTNTGGLRIEVIAPTEEERKKIGVTYGLSSEHGGLCVYGDINSENSDYKMELD